MQNHAKVGGILSIVSGGFGLLWLLGFVLVIMVMWGLTDPGYYDYRYGATPDSFLVVMMVFYGIAGLVILILGALAIVGGIFALRRNIWGLALAGAIAGTLVFFPCGIVAIIFMALGKAEFNTLPQPSPATVQT